MKKALFIVLLSSLLLVSCVSNEPNLALETAENLSEVCINENCFLVEIVDTDKSRATGLMYREEMDDNRGMLFIFDDLAVHNFWMKNTLISLDMIWVDEDYKVIYVEKMAQPCEEDPCEVYGTNAPSKYVLEINGGLSDQLGINSGDILETKIN